MRKNEIFIGAHHDKQVLYSVQTLYLQGFAGISKKVCDKHHKTVDNSYKLLYTVYCKELTDAYQLRGGK